MGSAQSKYLDFRQRQTAKRNAQAQQFFTETKRGQRAMNSKRMQNYIKQRNAALEKGANLRLEEERDDSKGERVWFSRCILDGRLRHWVLITHNTKYELRRREHVQDQTDQTSEEYVCHIKEYTIDQEKRDMSLTRLLIPEVDGYYICLIGWTRMSKDEVDAETRAVFDTFGTYNLLRNNCQDYLRLVADRILVDKAADYDWFLTNTKTKYQKDQWLKPPPEELLMRQVQNLQMQTQSLVQNQIQNQAQAQVQNQIQQQTQQQIQMQIQQQIQQQIQMQIQQQIQQQVQLQTQTALMNQAGSS